MYFAFNVNIICKNDEKCLTAGQELYAKLQDHLEENGINIMYNTTVKDIIVENNKIKEIVKNAHNKGKDGVQKFSEELINNIENDELKIKLNQH